MVGMDSIAVDYVFNHDTGHVISTVLLMFFKSQVCVARISGQVPWTRKAGFLVRFLGKASSEDGCNPYSLSDGLL